MLAANVEYLCPEYSQYGKRPQVVTHAEYIKENGKTVIAAVQANVVGHRADGGEDYPALYNNATLASKSMSGDHAKALMGLLNITSRMVRDRSVLMKSAGGKEQARTAIIAFLEAFTRSNFKKKVWTHAEVPPTPTPKAGPSSNAVAVRPPKLSKGSITVHMKLGWEHHVQACGSLPNAADSIIAAGERDSQDEAVKFVNTLADFVQKAAKEQNLLAAAIEAKRMLDCYLTNSNK